jgi:hypothetical protein
MSEHDTIKRYFTLLHNGATRLIGQGKGHAPMLITVKRNGESSTVIPNGWTEEAVGDFIRDAWVAQDTLFVVRIHGKSGQVEVQIESGAHMHVRDDLLEHLQDVHRAESILAFEFFGKEATYLAMCPIVGTSLAMAPLLVGPAKSFDAPPPPTDATIH